MRWSQMHIPTLREDPAEADAPSHRLLLRAGYIRQLAAGHYALLPLGVRVRSKIIQIIREEMDRIGAQEFLLPGLHPAEIWQRSGRWEEIFTTLAQELSSYRQLPQIWYQFRTKFRDEPRPKAGLLRAREFTMKDSYSFDLAPEGLDRSFDRHHEAYVRIFERLGIPAMPVEASSGSMGGSASVEFMCLSDAGEDVVAHCPACGYAANLEKATSRLAPAADGPGLPAPERFDTPGVRTIDDLAENFDASADRQIKTLVYVVDGRTTLVLLRGDHALAEQKLIDTTGAAAVRPAYPEEIRAALHASAGSLGAVGVTGLQVIADVSLRGRRDMFTGANIDGAHLRGVDVDRDIVVDTWADLREVVAGEACVRCGEPLQLQRAIEVGRIFKLGHKYSEALGASVLNADGKRAMIIMGSYSIGVERAMATIVECHRDERGIVWPLAVAPFEVAVVVAQPDDADTARYGAQIYEQLRDAGVDVIVDDRPDRVGVKFRDVELVGIPVRVTVGKRGLADGVVEVTCRASGETERVAVDEAVEHVRRMLASHH
ncbi:MAG TPA: proline--tRNA ligase [Micromonosporaceae bacterium]